MKLTERISVVGDKAIAILRGDTASDRLWGFLLVLALTVAVRIQAAALSYPVQGDAGHFVESAMLMAQGDPKGFSPHWSQLPIFVGAWALENGFDPKRAMQMITLLAGIAVPPLMLLLSHLLLRRWTTGFMTGVILATTPIAVEYSVNSLGEMPFMACSIAGLCMFLRAVERRGWMGPWLLAGGALYGMGIYSRPFESAVALGVALLFLVWRYGWSERILSWWHFILPPVAFVLLAMPLQLNSMRQESPVPLSGKLVNIAFGDFGYDSKAMKSLDADTGAEFGRRGQDLVELGVVGFMWKYKESIARGWFVNMGRAARFLNDTLFPASLRIGMFWTVLFAAFALATGWKRGFLSAWCLPAGLILAMPMLLSLSFVHPRWMVPALPYAVLILADAVAANLPRDRRALLFAAVLVLCFAATQNVTAAKFRVADESWRYFNQEKLAARMWELGCSDEDVIMVPGPNIAINFYRKHVDRWTDLRYSKSVDVLEEYCRRKDVDVVVVGSSSYPHWPIQRLFDCGVPPANWVLLDRVRFATEDKRLGYREEQYLVYRRTDPEGAEVATAGVTP